MKFMKLGSKPDTFHADGTDIRFVATELSTDIVVHVGDVKFYLHKFPLLSKSAYFQKLVASSSEENDDEIHIDDIPGGPHAFEICAKFCYGMIVTLNAYNVVAARCAAEYLQMNETMEKGNLVYKIEVFLSSSIFRSWKDSIIALQSTKLLLRWCEDLKIISRCIDSIASKTSIETSKVQWSYTYNRKKSENGKEPQWNGICKQQLVPRDWWVEDLCELDNDFYKRIMVTIKSKGLVSDEVIGESLKSYALRKLPGFDDEVVQGGDGGKIRSLVETIICLLPCEAGSVSCSFLLKLLKMAILLDASENLKRELIKRIGRQLDEASVKDLLILAPSGQPPMDDTDLVRSIFEEFLMLDQRAGSSLCELEEVRSPCCVSNASKMAVTRLVDSYLAEMAREASLPLSKFIEMAEIVSTESRPVHDGLYRAIDMYLKEHPGLSKSEKKRICRLMDCRKLSTEACMHAAQNERLPLRVVVQVLFFEQVRATATSGAGGPDVPDGVVSHENGGSNGSSRSATTNTEDEWDAAHISEQLRGSLATLSLASSSEKGSEKGSDKTTGGIFRSRKILSKLWSNKGNQHGENSSSDASHSPGSGSINPGETKSTPSRNRRHSVS